MYYVPHLQIAQRKEESKTHVPGSSWVRQVVNDDQCQGM